MIEIFEQAELAFHGGESVLAEINLFDGDYAAIEAIVALVNNPVGALADWLQQSVAADLPQWNAPIHIYFYRVKYGSVYSNRMHYYKH